MSNMNPEEVILSEAIDDGRDGILPPEHPASGEGTVSAGEVLSHPGNVISPGAGQTDDTQR
jgi:hypothetical protein